MARMDRRDTRRVYTKGRLSRKDLATHPMEQLALWLDEAQLAGSLEPTAMILATASAEGQPSLRTVLLKHLDDDGLCWYTDARSLKGRQLAENPSASILFYWPELERQVRIDGPVTMLESDLADAYFASRPPGSQLAAAASHQSQPIGSREELEQRLQAMRRQYPDGGVPRPSNWVGYRLEPTQFEFWQGRDNRLHDRMQYTREGLIWTITRLMP